MVGGGGAFIVLSQTQKAVPWVLSTLETRSESPAVSRGSADGHAQSAPLLAAALLSSAPRVNYITVHGGMALISLAYCWGNIRYNCIIVFDVVIG